jgi:threonine dehydrogenase-like Zn-dependent dehydrogenase
VYGVEIVPEAIEDATTRVSAVMPSSYHFGMTVSASPTANSAFLMPFTYCGIGTISLFLAKQAKKVYGVEIVPEAIEDAKRISWRVDDEGVGRDAFFIPFRNDCFRFSDGEFRV